MTRRKAASADGLFPGFGIEENDRRTRHGAALTGPNSDPPLAGTAKALYRL
jgi:hypothetical protein